MVVARIGQEVEEERTCRQTAHAEAGSVMVLLCVEGSLGRERCGLPWQFEHLWCHSCGDFGRQVGP